MTYNVRVDAGARDPSLAWPARRPQVAAIIGRAAPDLLGTQEAKIGQVRNLADDLPDHHWIGLGRDAGGAGEMMAFFFRTARFASLESGHFWLSDTPDVPSASWGNRYLRMVTWARLRDRDTGRELAVANTHFDHESEVARTKSAELLTRFVTRWPVGTPVVVMGDFNAEAGRSPLHAQLTGEGSFRDAWDEAAVRLGDTRLDSFNDFRAPRHEGGRIDWILVRGPVAVQSVEVVAPLPDALPASDHYPVIATLSLV